MIVDEASEVVITVASVGRPPEKAWYLRFWDLASLEIVDEQPLERSARLIHSGGHYILIRPEEGSLWVQVGDISSRATLVEATVSDRTTILSGDASALEAVPHRTDLGPGHLLEWADDGLVIRRYQVFGVLSQLDPYPNEMPETWWLSPDRKQAVLSRTKGSSAWPVVELDTGEVVNVIEGRGTNEPRLCALSAGGFLVGVHDEIHHLDRLVDQLSGGTRLSTAGVSGHITQISLTDDGDPLVSWFGKESLPELEASAQADPARLARLFEDGGARMAQRLSQRALYGRILRLGPPLSIKDTAAFDEWVDQPHVLPGGRVPGPGVVESKSSDGGP